jgi:hypothetical protein
MLMLMLQNQAKETTFASFPPPPRPPQRQPGGPVPFPAPMSRSPRLQHLLLFLARETGKLRRSYLGLSAGHASLAAANDCPLDSACMRRELFAHLPAAVQRCPAVFRITGCKQALL